MMWNQRHQFEKREKTICLKNKFCTFLKCLYDFTSAHKFENFICQSLDKLPDTHVCTSTHEFTNDHLPRKFVNYGWEKVCNTCTDLRRYLNTKINKIKKNRWWSNDQKQTNIGLDSPWTRHMHAEHHCWNGVCCVHNVIVSKSNVDDNVRAGGPSEQTDSGYIIWHNAHTTCVDEKFASEGYRARYVALVERL